MKQQVRFCTSSDGVRIAWSVTGAGAPLVMSASWLTHLEHQWDSLAWRPWLEHFSQSHALLRYDSRGCGLSDRAVGDVSFESWMRDFEAITDAAGFDRFAILATCQGGPIAVEYAARNTDRRTCDRREAPITPYLLTLGNDHTLRPRDRFDGEGCVRTGGGNS